MKCPSCEKDNREEARFCKYCGAQLAAPPAPETIAASAPAPEAEPPQAQDATPPAQPAGQIELVPEASVVPLEAVQPVPASWAEPEIGTGLAPEPGQAPAFNNLAEQRLAVAQDVAVEAPPASEPSEPPSPAVPALTLPVILAGRYELTEVVEQSDSRGGYRAYDRLRCWQCGMLRMDMTDEFCSECGVEIGQGAPCRIQVGDMPLDAPQENLLTDVDTGMIFWIQPELIQPSGLSTVTPANKGLRLCVGYASDPGAVRELDEDSLLVMTGLGMLEGVARPSLGLYAVADGMGGHDNGQVASRRVLQVLAELLLPRLLAPALSGETILPEAFEEQVRDAVKEANKRLTLEAHAADNDMGSTLTLALVRDGTAIIANVGDSRTYLWRNGALEQVTIDHSAVARLIEGHMLEPDEIYTHPRRNEIYRVMGDKPEIEVDLFTRQLQPGDRLVLCCDGVWEMIRNEGIADVLLAYDDPQAACDEMVRQANLAGGEDNISVIVVNVQA